MNSPKQSMIRWVRLSLVSAADHVNGWCTWPRYLPSPIPYTKVGTSAAPVFNANAAGPAGTTALRPKKRTFTPGPCSRSQSRATIRFAASAAVIDLTADRPSGMTSMPNLRRVEITASSSDPGKRSATALMR